MKMQKKNEESWCGSNYVVWPAPSSKFLEMARGKIIGHPWLKPRRDKVMGLDALFMFGLVMATNSSFSNGLEKFFNQIFGNEMDRYWF